MENANAEMIAACPPPLVAAPPRTLLAGAAPGSSCTATRPSRAPSSSRTSSPGGASRPPCRGAPGTPPGGRSNLHIQNSSPEQSSIIAHPQFPELPLRHHPAHVRLDLDDGPHLLLVVAAHQVAPRPRLQPHNVAAQVPELLRQHARPYQRLQPHVPCSERAQVNSGRPRPLYLLLTSLHLLVLFLPVVGPEILLNDDGGGAHLEELPPVVPSADAALEDEDLLGEDTVPLLLKEQVLRVFQEHLQISLV